MILMYAVPAPAVKNTSWMRRFFKDSIHLDKSSFSLTAGLRAAAFVIAPIILAFVIQQPALFLAAIGAIVLTSTAKMLPTIPSRILLLACFTEAASFGLGTLAATTGHLFSPVLLGIAVFAALAVWANTKWAAVGMYTAIIFAIGVGLPGFSIQSAGQRTLFSLIGTLWALLGVEIHRFALSRRRIQLSGSESAATTEQQQQQQPSTPRLAALRSALPIGIVSALGYTVGLVLGLPRDFWIVVPIILAIRPTSSTLTMTFTSMMIIGTVAGALIATVITLETNNHYLLLALLFSFAVVVFATLGVSITLTQIFLVPFVIILLNIYYPGQWYLPFIRILNVAIGAAIAVAVVYLLSALSTSRKRRLFH
jgi:hypothetical protein